MFTECDGACSAPGVLTALAVAIVLDAIPEPLERKGYSFNGEDQYLATRQVKGLDSSLSALTLEAWIKIPSRNVDKIILCKGNEHGKQKQFLLKVDASGKLVFESSSGNINQQITTVVPTNTLTHVCVIFSKQGESAGKLTFYINGEQNGEPVIIAISSLEKYGKDLFIGRDFDNNYFSGLIKEVRIWKLARSSAQIAMYQHRSLTGKEPGLVGYWRLNAIQPQGETTQAIDLSPYQNHLELGGILTEYQPTPESLPRLLPQTPVSVSGKVLELDGDNDVVIIEDPENTGLGKYDQLTLTLWFKAADPQSSYQVIYSQGDIEAGLNIYLSGGQLSVLAWKGNYGGSAVQEAMVTTSIDSAWVHLAVTIDESQLPNNAQVLKAFKNGINVGRANFKDYKNSVHETVSLEHINQLQIFPLSPVGPAYLGGIGCGGITRFEGRYSQPEGKYYFAGQLTDLRLWKGIKTTDDERYVALDKFGDDLILYLPLDESQGEEFKDPRSQLQTEAKFGKGHWQRSNLVLVNDGADAESENMHSHYKDLAALKWTDYEYTGRLWITHADAGIGVTFLSRYPENQDKYYRLGRHQGHPTFHLAANPDAVLSLKGEIDSRIDPKLNTWYRFRIQVQNQGSGTTIKASIWQDGSTEPTHFQINAHDDSPRRLTSGTVGLWTFGRDKKYFDNLEVKQLSGEQKVLLAENFESYAPFESPNNWKDSGVRIKNLLKILEFENQKVFGTTSEIQNIHTHYNGQGALGWKNYRYTGKLYISDVEGGIGVTFFSRYPESIDKYYRLRRDRDKLTFHLAPHPAGIQAVSGTIDSGVNPEINTWYCFLIEVEDTVGRINIKAKIWQEGDSEPTDFQIDAYDASNIRIHAGTVGLWTGGKGAKYFGELRVQGTSQANQPQLHEDFQAYSTNQTLSNWLETRGRNLYEEDASLFRVEDVENNIAQWQDITDYPLLLHPLNRDAFKFDGTRQYLATNLQTSLHLANFTLEAWVKPTRLSRSNPIFSLGTKDSPKLHFGINDQNQLILSSESEVVSPVNRESFSFNTSEFTHVAVSWDGNHATFYIAGEQKGSHAISGQMEGSYLEIGKKISSSEYFCGSIKEVRLWNTLRTLDAQIKPARYERVEPVPADLVGYWAFPQAEGAQTQDASANGNNLRLGGIESVRRPRLFDSSLTFTELSPLTPDYALEFDGDRDVLHLALKEEAKAATEQQRTVEFWFKATQTTRQQLLYHESKQQLGQIDEGFNIYIAANGELHAQIWSIPSGGNSETVRQISSSSASVLGQWHHVAVTIDGSQTTDNFKVYLDGNHLGSSSNAIWNSNPSHTIGLGGIVGSTRFDGNPEAQIYGFFLKGHLSELRIWNQVRQQSELKNNLYRPVSPETSGLIYLWQPHCGEENLTEPPVGYQYHYLPNIEASWQQPTWVNLAPDLGLFDPSATKLDGQDDYVEINLPHQVTLADLTVEAWVKPDALDGTRTLLSQAGVGTTQWEIQWVENQLNVTFGGNTPETQVFNYGLELHEWSHVAIIYFRNYKQIQLWVNGKCAQTETLTSASPIQIHNLKIGQNQTGQDCFEGLIKELRIWSSRRFARDLELYRFRRLAGNERFLLAYHPLNGDAVNHGELVSPDLLATSINQGFWRAARRVLSFSKSEDIIFVSDTQPDMNLEIHQRRTVEVWFKVENKSIYQRKQVIYKEGDHQRGLNIYVYDGKLYFGGYNQPTAESDWAGTWLSTDRIESGRWHHVTLVLDGRAEIRPASFYGLLDGKLVEVESGSQLWGHPGKVALGGTDLSIRFHDGEAAWQETHFLQGQVMALRIWNTVRTLEEIQSYRYRQLTGKEAKLVLWWRFDQLAKDSQNIIDGSGNGYTATLHSREQIKTIGSLPQYQLPQTTLNQQSLNQLAKIKKLYEQQKLSMDRLCALWYDIKHVGKADQKVLFDQVFNPSGGTQPAARKSFD